MDRVTPVSQRRRRRSRGAELLEFTLILLPMLAFITVLADTAYATWAEATMQRAVRIGVRVGVTLTATQLAAAPYNGATLTDAVKSTVQANSFGLLSGATGLSKIKVYYFQPPDPSDSSGTGTDVTALASGNAPGNIMTVAVEGFSLVPLMPRITSLKTVADNNPLVVNVNSADRIEPSKNIPVKGTAP